MNSSFSSDDEEIISSTNDTTEVPVKPDEPESSPENLVRKESIAVSVIRLVGFAMLTGAAFCACWFIYHYTSKAEHDAYETAYAGISKRIVDSFISDTSLKMWMAKTLATSVELNLLERNATQLLIDPMRFGVLTEEARLQAAVFLVAWSPWISTEAERLQFEEFSTGVNFTLAPNPPCFMCGSPDQTYLNLEDLVNFPGYPPVKCGDLSDSGRMGILRPESCTIASVVSQSQGCVCGPVPEGLMLPSNTIGKPDFIYRKSEEDGTPIPMESPQPPYAPIWQFATLVDNPKLMWDQFADPNRAKALQVVNKHRIPTMGESYMKEEGYVGSLLFYPLLKDGDLVGTLLMEFEWRQYYSGIFPEHSNLVYVVIEDSCSVNYTHSVSLETNTMDRVSRPADLDMDKVYSSTWHEFDYIVGTSAPSSTDKIFEDACRYRFHVHSSQALKDEFISNDPWIFTAVAATIFVITSLTFWLYDVVVRKRQEIVMVSAKQTNDIVTSLFPQNVRDRLFEQAQQGLLPSKKQMHTFLENGAAGNILTSEPIADLFPSATVMFLDIAGFTAWCSERDPSQVFRLLETLYRAFDEVASALGVFKVETIGDSYVAVCGLPEYRENHAVVMAKYARACLERMSRLTAELEVYLGPSTGDLQARIGLHSGPVTAGVLRGEKARFQLFGDTVNTASRVESSGAPHRIHCSKATADLLVKAKKGRWIVPREAPVHVKGKGELHTYWVEPRNRAGSATEGSATGQDLSSEQDPGDVDDTEVAGLSERNFRLVGKCLKSRR